MECSGNVRELWECERRGGLGLEEVFVFDSKSGDRAVEAVSEVRAF